jgi:hypothetical protein
MKERTCDRCKKRYGEIFDTLVRCDYVEPGKGKPYEWHLCVNCRKDVVEFIEKK